MAMFQQPRRVVARWSGGKLGRGLVCPKSPTAENCSRWHESRGWRKI